MRQGRLSTLSYLPSTTLLISGNSFSEESSESNYTAKIKIVLTIWSLS